MNYEMLDWDAPAGRLLKKLAKALPKSPALEIVVFGSAPLQLLVDSNFLSKDCDIIGDDELARIAATLTEPRNG